MRLVGQNIEHYRILDKLNGEGSGIAYKVLDTKRAVVCVARMLEPALLQDAGFMHRFEQEARTLACLNHPNLLATHAFYKDAEPPFMVLEYVKGSSLALLIRRQGPLDYIDAVPLFRQILRGLAAAHRQGIVHRNINPSNILVTDDGLVKIADFGAAKKKNGRELSFSSMPARTLYYLSPEHVRSTVEVDRRSDLYAVGMALYEALTGQTPFEAEDTAYLVMRAIVEEAFKPPTAFVPGIPDDLAGVVMKAIAKDPADRYQSAEEMLAALEVFKPTGTVLRAPTPDEPPDPEQGEALSAPPARVRRPVPWLAYSFIGLALVVTVVLAGWMLRDILSTSSPGSGNGAEATEAVVVQTGIYERVLPSAGAGLNGQGVLMLKAVPYGSISVSGSVLGEDSLEVNLRAGRRRVFFNHPVYGLRQRIVEVGPGQRKEVICYYEGFLRVQASDEAGMPIQAELFVDDQGTGRRASIETLYSLPPGAYTVEVFREGYLGRTTTVEVLPASDDSLLTVPPIAPLAFVLQQVEE